MSKHAHTKSSLTCTPEHADQMPENSEGEKNHGNPNAARNRARCAKITALIPDPHPWCLVLVTRHVHQDRPSRAPGLWRDHDTKSSHMFSHSPVLLSCAQEACPSVCFCLLSCCGACAATQHSSLSCLGQSLLYRLPHTLHDPFDDQRRLPTMFFND